MFHPNLYKDVKVSDIMIHPKRTYIIDLRTDDIETIASKFLRNEKFTMPVVKDGYYLGFISRANFFTKYQEQIKEFVSI